MSLNGGMPNSTLPRSESEIVVDFTREKQTSGSEDEMSSDSLNEGDAEILAAESASQHHHHHHFDSTPTTSRNFPGSSRSTKNALYIEESDGEDAKIPPTSHKSSRKSQKGTSEVQDVGSSSDLVSGAKKRRETASLKPPSPSNYSFRSTIGLLPSSRKRRGLRQQVQ
ncbi:hypothetical protein Pmani_032480 [Petrolisthes manimaculis]|uniref:Uncharacterized protein n=1 Tax=Petrolisthes manimaculis TaxID=1843537 RepID=A0AAE1NSY9_9EUCA|nr:hypothetical protein Pmani_032480 [Petrolisthes manimaculis]